MTLPGHGAESKVAAPKRYNPAASGPHAVAVWVGRLDNLWQALHEAPRPEAKEVLARIDRIARDLSSEARPQLACVRLHCDAAAGHAEPPEELASVWSRLCAGKALAYRRQARATRRDGWMALRYGFIAFAAALAASLAVGELQPLPQWLNRPLSEGFLIASWVSLWRPLELLLYEWLTFARIARSFDRLCGLPVEVVPDMTG